MPAGWCLSASPPPPRVRLRSFRAETFHGLTKPSRDSRTSRCLFCASPSSRSGSHRRRVRPDVSPTRLGCPGPPRAETEARIMTHGASVAMLMPPWPGAISPSPSPLPRATAENTGWHRQGIQDSPTEVLETWFWSSRTAGIAVSPGHHSRVKTCGPAASAVPPQTWMADCRIGAAHWSHLIPRDERP